MTDLGTLGGSDSNGRAVNDRGQVVGYSTTKDLHIRAFLWQRGHMTDLGSLGGGESSPALFSAINQQGQIVGESVTKAGKRHAFLWQHGVMHDLNPPGRHLASQAVGVNGRGQVAIYSWDSETEDHQPEALHTWLWQRGRFTDLGNFSKGVNALASTTFGGMNDHGWIVGTSDTTFGGSHPYRWAAGKMTDLRVGSNTTVYAVSNRGQVVGLKGANKPWVWDGRRLSYLPTLATNRESRPVDINEHNQIAGWSYTQTGARHAVLWTLLPG